MEKLRHFLKEDPISKKCIGITKNAHTAILQIGEDGVLPSQISWYEFESTDIFLGFNGLLNDNELEELDAKIFQIINENKFE